MTGLSHIEARNALVRLLEAGLGGPKVIMADQVGPEAPFPYLLYSMMPYAGGIGLGNYYWLPAGDSVDVLRHETAEAIFSLTACGRDRGSGQSQIHGDDEALALADAAFAYLRHKGYLELMKAGLTVIDIGAVQNRTALVIDEADRRYGFDAQVRWMRVDSRRDPAIASVGVKKGNPRNA
jgi:hypothetical protein